MGHDEAEAELIERTAARDDLAAEGAALAEDVRMGDADDEACISDGASAVTDEDMGVPADIPLGEEPLFDSGADPLEGGDRVAGAETPIFAEGVGEPVGGAPPGGRPGSSSDGAAAAPLPPPPGTPPGVQRGKQTRNSPMAVVFVPGGKLTYYYSAKNEICTAECSNKKHGRCVKTKTMREPTKAMGRLRGQGRPVGWLAAWLGKGIDCESKAKHWAEESEPTYAERVAARELVQGDDSADAALLMAGEAPIQDGAEEPERVP